ncbi:VanZ family protein [Anaeromyxobacter sp. Fw109-5]|uniref:VanZ family protein n=1 Tax=Anaeromyxobacter sp. (strain Fw109-5) TaxID=404589 RepID=UPI000158A693|nr:VanZ family protein [Anaeromyxobacter sp. Fw109-5]ABS25725.1 VanZ family protein [Anaeromyxobacter sp. Fw109-5]
MTNRTRTALLASAATAWAALIFWASSQPNPFPQLPRGLFDHDKLLHASAYAVLGALVRGALGGARLRPWMALAATVAVGTAYGASDELHQAFVPNRSADPGDLAADALGAAAGAAVASLILRRVGARASIRG